MFRDDLLKGKRVLVTGGGSGLGKSIAQRYMELGAELFICGRREEVLKSTSLELAAATGGRCTPMVCDVRDADAVDRLFTKLWQAEPLDVVVNNAAGSFVAQTERLSPRAVDAVLGIVLHGSFYCTIAAGRRWMEAGRGGCVLNILSTPSFTGGPFMVPSAAAKAGVLAMTRSLAVEWGPKGIRVVAVSPGIFPTEGALRQLHPEGLDTQPQELDVPLRRVGEHRELADLCSFLVSDGAAYITGENYVIDGGRWLQGTTGHTTQVMGGWSNEKWDALRAPARK